MTQSSLARMRQPAWPWTGLVLAAWTGVIGGAASGGTSRPSLIHDGRASSQSDALLVAYFRQFLADQDFEAFRGRVEARYSEESLCRFLADSPGATTRRAAVMALSSLGDFPRSNPVLGRALRDSDPVVRRLAEDALWTVWFRADAADNNRMLKLVVQHAGRGDMKQAEALATRLIAVAPRFAEAYNQRAIIYFGQGRFAESAQDCERVLSINPYHFGALSGLAQCQLHLNRPDEAIKALRRASKLQPYNTSLRETIRVIEAQVERGES